MSDKCECEPIRRSDRWVIQATDKDGGEVTIITCGVDPTLEQVGERIRALRLDDDRIDSAGGEPRKYQ
jgi:hypothetical protein